MDHPYRPLVVGAPRSGFALLSSILIHLLPHAPNKSTLQLRLLDKLTQSIGPHISDRIVAAFAARGVTHDLLYNPNFRLLIGGPKWLSTRHEESACFRKYIGVRGRGDFTLVTRHPREILDVYEVVHSHVDPSLWLAHPAYAEYTKYASVRNPIGILNSSVFSLNALASEYIQKFVPAAEDNDLIRQRLAVYKLTDLDFFSGLCKFLAGYLQEFLACRAGYIQMRWEDLLQQPVETILHLANRSNISITAEHAAEIWKRLDHVNLTGNHKHNYRVGKGIVADWMNWLTNEHLQVIRDHGLEPAIEELGYGPIPTLDESRYTPFQQEVRGYLSRGEVCRDFADQDLFTFAFNKSNLSSERFPFRRHEWREWTQIERSIFTDEPLEREIWDVAETATGQVNAMLYDFLAEDMSSPQAAQRAVELLKRKYLSSASKTTLPVASFFEQAEPLFHAPAAAVLHAGPPILALADVHGFNIVQYQGEFFALSQSLGPVDLAALSDDQLDAFALEGTCLRAATLAAAQLAIQQQTAQQQATGATC